MDDHYLFLSSDLSKDRYPSNRPDDFTVELPHPYVLDGQWKCGLKEIKITLQEGIVYFCSDVCVESYAEDTMLPVLRALQKPKGKETYFHFDNPMYVNIKPNVLNRVRIFIRDRQLQPLDVQDSYIHCTLHLERCQ